MEAASTVACSTALACWEGLDFQTELEFRDELAPAWDDTVLYRLLEQARFRMPGVFAGAWNEEDYNDAQTKE